MKKILLILVSLICFLHVGISQTSNSSIEHEPYFRTYFSFGAGVSLAQGIPTAIYQDGHSNVQIGIQFEKTLNHRFSLVSGLEIEQNVFSFDGNIGEQGDEGDFQITIADNDIKYTKLTQRNISLPLQARIYYRPNTSKSSSNAYLQGGLRISANGTTSFSYRRNNEAISENLKAFANAYNLQAELMVGFKGNFFKRFDLLNASSIGVIYQFTQMFDDRALQNIRPIHFTWRFLF